MITWSDFPVDVDSRLLLKLGAYQFAIDFVDQRLLPSERAFLGKALSSTVVDTLKATQNCSLSLLRQQPDEEDTIISLAFGQPVFGFLLKLTPTRLLVSKQDCSIEDLIVSLPLFEKIFTNLFSTETKWSLWNAAASSFASGAYRTGHLFKHNIRLGSRLTKPKEYVTNQQIMQTLLSHGPDSVVGMIQPDSVLRSDLTLSMDKLINHRPANIWIKAIAPWNVTQRDLSLTFEARRNDGALEAESLSPKDFTEFDDIVVHFYRDMCINRVMTKIFNDVRVEAR